MDLKNIKQAQCLADMAQATAWLNFTTAQAQHDILKFGEWRVDYSAQASMFQNDYDKAGRELVSLTS